MTTARLDHVINSEKAASEKNEEKVLRVRRRIGGRSGLRCSFSCISACKITSDQFSKQANTLVSECFYHEVSPRSKFVPVDGCFLHSLDVVVT